MIRKATHADTHELSKLLKQLMDYHIQFDPSVFIQGKESDCMLLVEGMLNDEFATVFVHTKDGAVDAFAEVYVESVDHPNVRPHRILYVGTLVVDESCRDSGIGTELMNHLIGYAKRKNCKRIELMANAHNINALKFYESIGMNPSKLRLSLNVEK